jgi:ABC-type multidrug transport system fused ATPase/permease subunit
MNRVFDFVKQSIDVRFRTMKRDSTCSTTSVTPLKLSVMLVFTTRFVSFSQQLLVIVPDTLTQTAGVTFTDLSVTGAGGMKIHLRTFPDAIKEFILSPLLMIGPKFGLFQPAPKKLLQGFNGVVRPGEMVLVLGRPGSGCSTFLKARWVNIHS